MTLDLHQELGRLVEKRLANIAVACVSWTVFDGSCKALFWIASFSNSVLLQSRYHRLLSFLRLFLILFLLLLFYCCYFFRNVINHYY